MSVASFFAVQYARVLLETGLVEFSLSEWSVLSDSAEWRLDFRTEGIKEVIK